MSDSSSPQPAEAEARKRKRSLVDSPPNESSQPRPHPSSSGGVYVDIPFPSSSAIAALNAPHLSDSQVSLPSSIFDGLDNSAPIQQHESMSASEYIPSASSLAMAARADTSGSVDTSALRPMPTIPAAAFEPYLDDTTGMDLDAAESRLEAMERRRSRATDDEEGGNSSPVESFSPQRPEDVPRLGVWVLPALTAENSNPAPPDYTSQEVLSQIPYIDEDFYSDDDDDALLIRRAAVAASSQPSPAKEQRRGEDERRLSTPPVQSTPAFPARERQQQEEVPLPSQPILSQPEPEIHIEHPSSTPVLPPHVATQNVASSASASTSSSSSLGWSTLPRPEIIELVHRSPHIPAFLKDEIERFILRAARSSSPSSSKVGSYEARRESPRRRSNSNSQSQSQSQGNNDDSETQEDGFLRTKKVWCMDLLLLPSSPNSSSAGEGLSQLVQKLTQQTTLSEAASSQRGAIAIILLLDTVQVTFDVHELEESLASILRMDRRYSIQYDANGVAWAAASALTTAANADAGTAAEGGSSELEQAKAEVLSLQTRLEASAAQIESLTTRLTALTKEKDDAVAQHDFVRTLYDRASLSSSTAQASAASALERVTLLETQLDQGLALHRAALDKAVERWKGRIKQLEAEKAFMRAQKERTEGEEVRRKAALWDTYQREERDRERSREERIKANEEKRRKLALQLGVVGTEGNNGQGVVNDAADGLGPFARPSADGVREPSPVDEMDELAALAREAAEAGDVLSDLGEEGVRRSRRSRRAPVTNASDSNATTEDGSSGSARGLSGLNASNRAPPRSAAEMASQLEAATLSSTQALHDSRQDLEDQFQIFSSSAATPQATAEDGDSHHQFDAAGIDLDIAPSAGANLAGSYTTDLFGSANDSGTANGIAVDTGAELAGQEGGGGDGGWGESFKSTDLPPEFTSQSLLLDDAMLASGESREYGEGEEGESGESRFVPHTQASPPSHSMPQQQL